MVSKDADIAETLAVPPRKVLHLRSSGGVLGAENVIIELAKHSDAFGYHSIVGTLNDVRDAKAEFMLTAKELGLSTTGFKCKGKLDLACALEIRRFVAGSKIDLVHCHGYKEDFYAILSRIDVPMIATNHLWKTTSVSLRIYKALDIRLLRMFDLVTGVSDEIVTEMREVGITGAVKVSNGVDVAAFDIGAKPSDLASELGFNSGCTVLGMISSLTPEKNHELALQALSRIGSEDVKLLIVGDGPLDSVLKARVSQAGLGSRVLFLGRRSDVRKILSMIDIFLLPSLQEGLPMALLEAMACGKAVIASKVGDAKNLVTSGTNGLLVHPCDTDGLAAAIETLLANPSLVAKLGRQARRTVVEQFSSSRMTAQYCELYDRLLGPKQRGTQ
ncbi:glycosyltransferase family 4 protein [Geomonas terrae]|nr:glycosyltransferase family 4 protein [Geomonas terrae]